MKDILKYSSDFTNGKFQDFIRYRGDKILLTDTVPEVFGAGALVNIAINGEGQLEYQVQADSKGFYTLQFDAPPVSKSKRGELTGSFAMYITSADGLQISDTMIINTLQVSPDNPANAVPKDFVTLDWFNAVEEFPVLKKPTPGICGCSECSNNDAMIGSSTDGFSQSYTPSEHGVELATGKRRQSMPITSFSTRMLGFDLQLHHTSLTDYNSAWGQGVSHSFGMMIIQTGELTGQIITADLRCFEIFTEDGFEWCLPAEFFATLYLDPACDRWTLTHYSGTQFKFYQAAQNCPGYPLSICDPNNNTMNLGYDASGCLQWIKTDLGQMQFFEYDADGMLDSYTDHIGRQWNFMHDAQGRLTQIKQPVTEYADVKASQEITEQDLSSVLLTQSRVWNYGYTDETFPNHITSIMDPRGAIPEATSYDARGRVITKRINGKNVVYQYQSVDNPAPLAKLESNNIITRVTDREGNITDYEIHGLAGGPIIDRGAFGLRRTVTFTETGKGNAPLRDDEPRYWEQRWLHDCDCLKPLVIVQPFSSDDSTGLVFDNNGIPSNWPRDIYTYNRNRQETSRTYTDGINSIRTLSTYQAFSFGQNNQFSRLLSQTDPRAFDDKPIYSGLNFISHYQYDNRGNRTRQVAPTVTRGLDTPQTISEFWTYNNAGQVLSHIDPNGNITTHSYYVGTSVDGNINSQGEFGGYLQSITRGADGSKDPVSNLTSTYKVNPLGMTTREIDAKGFSYDTQFNDLQEPVTKLEPPVTLRNGQQVQYKTLMVYDGVGNLVIQRRTNIDYDGTLSSNRLIDRSMTYDAVNNLLSERVEVDENEVNDLITRYGYDKNDDRNILQKPEGNREFTLYDERRLVFKTFYGVAPSLQRTVKGTIPFLDKRRLIRDVFLQGPVSPFIGFGFPADKRAETLIGTTFVGLSINNYDARLNLVRMRDGRGNFEQRFFDFFNREFAYTDANSNGWLREFDDASNILTESRGAVSKTSGQITQLLERSYYRFDEIGRQYQQVRDIDLSTNESRILDPDDGNNSSYLNAFDPGSRVVLSFDANGNPTSMNYDAADRPITTSDALGNQQSSRYDANSNIVSMNELEMPGPSATGAQENYVTTFVYDELNRRTEQHIRGLDGNSIDHAWLFAYDSRNNQRLVQDAENNYSLIGFDDNDRQILMQRFDGEPLIETPTELQHYEWAYDKNSNTVEERALSDVNDLQSLQVTRHAFDNLDRNIRTVYPDSDDPIDGSNDGPDGIYDRIEVRYDQNSNPIQVTDQRGVVFNTRFDPGNRPTEQNISLPDGVPGTTRQAFSYDALNRTTTASNNYASIDQTFDTFSRLTSETQTIRLDGSGFDNDWELPVQVTHRYDKQSNRIACQVLEDNNTDLDIATTFDALNRTDNISAGYFSTAIHPIADYVYIGPGRIQRKTLGNGAALTCTYDPKRRLQTHQWNGPNRLLAGFEYDYDRMDNALFERFIHDQGLCDHFRYNNRYEVTGVSYRVPGRVAPQIPANSFDYDDQFNRRQASFGNPFEGNATTNDSYAINKANEYTQITRNGNATTPAHDRAGNSTRFLVRPITSDPDQQDVIANARWDAYNLLFDLDPGSVNLKQDYRYDPLRRRIATMELDGKEIGEGSRRYIYDGWSVVEERLFDPGVTLDSAASALERIYVNGMQIDEPLLTAIDRDQDGELGGSHGKNVRDMNADQEYYFLDNRLGSVMGLLDADRADRMLEYYRYSIYGEPTVLSIVENDGLEITHLDLSDNFNLIPQRFSEELGNVYMFTARRFDEKAGLYYYRHRYYEFKAGRFLSRDPLGYVDTKNLYTYANNKPANLIDPSGLVNVKLRIEPVWNVFPKMKDVVIDDAARKGIKGSTTIGKSVQIPGEKLTSPDVIITSVICNTTNTYLNRKKQKKTCKPGCSILYLKSIFITVRPKISYQSGNKGAAIHEATHALQIANRIKKEVNGVVYPSMVGCHKVQEHEYSTCEKISAGKARTAIVKAIVDFQKTNSTRHILEKQGEEMYKKHPIEQEARKQEKTGRFPEGVTRPDGTHPQDCRCGTKGFY